MGLNLEQLFLTLRASSFLMFLNETDWKFKEGQNKEKWTCMFDSVFIDLYGGL